MEERRHDHDKQAAQRREEERLLKKEKERKQEQKRLAEEKAEAEAQVVKNQLLQANLGPTPSRPGTLVSFYHTPLPPPSPSPMKICTLMPTPPPPTPFPLLSSGPYVALFQLSRCWLQLCKHIRCLDMAGA